MRENAPIHSIYKALVLNFNSVTLMAKIYVTIASKPKLVNSYRLANSPRSIFTYLPTFKDPVLHSFFKRSRIKRKCRLFFLHIDRDLKATIL